MKANVAVLLFGLFALMIQGALARTLPPPWCPDLAWLVVIGVGLRWPTFLSGLLIAVVLGYAMDLVSGSLMGQHAFMRLVSYLAAALASRQLDLSGAIPVSIFVFGMTFVYGVMIVATLAFFVGSDGMGFTIVGSAMGHAVANVLAAGPIIAIVDKIVARLAEDDGSRRAGLPIGVQRRSFG
ncbi:MAG: hypothetical protein AB8G23_13165 [Myxococcota bacterium]